MPAQNYRRLMEQAMAKSPPGSPLLLHACCGPCASVALERLSPHFAVTLYYYNPNIMPVQEYRRRLDAVRELLRQFCGAYPVRLLEGPYEEDAFLREAEGLEGEPEGGARCGRCFGLRLHKTAEAAAQNGFLWMGTTLTVGPRKDAQLLNALGEQAARRQGVRFLPADFKKQDGHRRSAELSRQYGLYRQSDCGCPFSRRAAPAGGGFPA